MAVVEKAVVLDMVLQVEDMVVVVVVGAVGVVALGLGVLGMEVGLVKEEVQGMVLGENMGQDMVEVVAVVAGEGVVAV